MAAFAASRWAKWCLHCIWVSAGGILDEMPVVLLDYVPLSPCWSVCGAMVFCLWKWRDNDNEMKWEVLRKMITKRRGKTWRIYSYLQVKLACKTANLLVLHNMNPVAHSCRLHWLPSVLRFAPSRSNILCLFTGINRGEPPPKSSVCEIQTVHSSSERTSADVCLKKSLGS